MNIQNLDRPEVTAGIAAKAGEPAVPPASGAEKAKKVHHAARRATCLHAGVHPAANEERTDPVLLRAGAIDAVFQAAEAILNRMKDDLTAIIKIYPPYPPGSEERVRFLENYNGLRKQIDRISFPTQSEDGEAVRGITTQGWMPADPRWEYAIDAHGRIHTVAREDGPGGGGLPPARELPELPAEASDDVLRDALAQVQKALDTVQARRAQLWELLEPLCPADCYA